VPGTCQPAFRLHDRHMKKSDLKNLDGKQI
jgi:hypothetical protein